MFSSAAMVRASSIPPIIACRFEPSPDEASINLHIVLRRRQWHPGRAKSEGWVGNTPVCMLSGLRGRLLAQTCQPERSQDAEIPVARIQFAALHRESL